MLSASLFLFVADLLDYFSTPQNCKKKTMLQKICSFHSQFLPILPFTTLSPGVSLPFYLSPDNACLQENLDKRNSLV